MRLKNLLAAVVCSFTIASSFSQVKLPVPVNVQNAVKKQTRTESGIPGSAYWQNTADYNIKVDFDPTSRLLKGTVSINYLNSSPDTLKQLWFKLYPNYYKKGSARDSKVAASDLTDGVKITKMQIAGEDKDVKRLVIDGTNMYTQVNQILPKQSVKINIDYSYEVNKGSHQRTGQVDDGSFFIAYFFPRVAVYDDIDGWNKYPYLGAAEMYNDFCSFKAEITVPKNYAVWATGDLVNAKDVLQPAVYNRLIQAEKSDAIIDVISEQDASQNAVTTDNNTWKFNAENVTDFVFATSNHYMWKSSSLVVDSITKRRTRVDAVFNPEHKDFYDVAAYGRKTVELMSFKFPKWPFPYAHETVFDGLDQMEYPMMVNDNPLEDKESTITLTDHEIFHTMFPFYMGVNETKYGWMDEGWATIGEWLLSAEINPGMIDDYGVVPYERGAGHDFDVPITTLTTQQNGMAFYLNSYPKPAFGYLYVKDMLGEERFNKALHTYIRNWNGKHPIPQDFFNSMNEGAGENLNWFWKKWFYDGGIPDLSINEVKKAGANYRVLVESKGSKPVPVNLNLFYEDGTEERVHRSIAVWKDGNKTITVEFPASKALKKVTLESTYTPDSDKRNNVFPMR
ncbi:peptidase [Pedobacter sp. HMF7647]|uniref:Peptidase n=1 Tax=Hufsiella arboris TaxID=2695275 RepID=A0A7K1YBW0_9SPHI|nr:M1 family metallopeptidase [Hufsiella arboris]MXV52084.1 peptidase [Hufsiella arboris]